MGDLPPEHRDVYRPIRSVSYALSYQLFGTDPFGYHLLSISVHLLCTILIYLIVLRITKKNMVALITSLLFGAHPVHTEAITFITTSFDIIGMTFFFAAFHFYLLSQQKGNPDHIAHYRVAYFISILCAAIAFFTYELTLTLPFLLVLHQSCFGRQTGLNLWSKVKVHLPYFLAAIIYLTIRFVVVEVGSRGGYFAGSFYHTSLTMLKAFTKYLLILLFPINIGIEHVLPTNILTLSAYAVNKPAAFLSQSIFDPAVVLSILLFFGIFYAAAKFIKKMPEISFCLGWFLITFLPFSNLVFPHGVILAEKYMYLPSFAFCFLLSSLAFRIYNCGSRGAYRRLIKPVVIIFLVFLLCFYSIQTYHRNSDWKNEETLWTKSFQQVPNCPRINNNLGAVYLQQGRHKEALKHFHNSLLLKKDAPLPYLNIGILYLEEKDYNSSIRYFKEGLEYNPNATQIHYGIAEVYLHQNQLHLAIGHYQAILKSVAKSDAHTIHYKLGTCYFLLGNHTAAVAEFKRTLEINDRHSPSYKAVGVILIERGDYQLAVKYLEKSIKLNPGNADAWESLGMAFYHLNQTEKVTSAWEKALEIEYNPQIEQNLMLLQKNAQE